MAGIIENKETLKSLFLSEIISVVYFYHNWYSNKVGVDQSVSVSLCLSVSVSLCLSLSSYHLLQKLMIVLQKEQHVYEYILLSKALNTSRPTLSISHPGSNNMVGFRMTLIYSKLCQQRRLIWDRGSCKYELQGKLVKNTVDPFHIHFHLESRLVKDK